MRLRAVVIFAAAPFFRSWMMHETKDEQIIRDTYKEEFPGGGPAAYELFLAGWRAKERDMDRTD